MHCRAMKIAQNMTVPYAMCFQLALSKHKSSVPHLCFAATLTWSQAYCESSKYQMDAGYKQEKHCLHLTTIAAQSPLD